MTDLRIGQGIDIHRLVSGRKLVLGGVEIESEVGLDGHSDADVLLHALMDALLGAAGLGDIGHLFPNTDERWRGASSLDLLSIAYQKIRDEGWQLGNCDISVLLEAPKIGKHIPEMKTLIASRLDCSVQAIGIKATTAERIGFVGRGEGAFASAVVLLTRR